ncbi:MAG: HindIII family type II restriction endonuclease [Gemmatimonadetes bacterium]|nr:HindIII family type II restriction endonuclease [Gemmatimonadota bacterium]MYB57308.1 HindIII family type II restriction endonuclease [Gemmatimonadota bacterium]
MEIIIEEQVENRKYWVDNLSHLSGNFSIDAKRIEQELRQEIQAHDINRIDIDTLLGHLRLCGVIPECYGSDTSEEKLYSKYTDAVIHEAYTAMGFTSVVLTERADVADVECVTDDYSFVADAKAFRLSRTAKNQKDFKVQAMDNWKHGKPYAMVVCPVYQLPSRTSQIYQQAAARSVCIATYTHLAVLVRYAYESTQSNALGLVHEIFRTVEAMNPSKSANSYWQAVNRTLLDFNDDDIIGKIWREEKLASNESILISREEALTFLAAERERIMRLSRTEAIREVLKWKRLDSKIQTVESITQNGILNLE